MASGAAASMLVAEGYKGCVGRELQLNAFSGCGRGILACLSSGLDFLLIGDQH
jgi:hypothetical protein